MQMPIKKQIAIIGKNFGDLRDHLRQSGIDYTVFRDIRKTEPIPRKHTVYVDFSSTAALIEAVRATATPFNAAVAVYEQYILPAAEVASALGVNGIPVTAAEACTDKYLMRSLFAKAPKPISPDFAEVKNIDEVLAFAAQHDYPLILKPANLAKSLLVTKNTDETELIKNYDKMMQNIEAVYAKYSPDRPPKVVIEEFMEGSIHSIDAFVDGQGAPHLLEHPVDYQTGYDIGYDDNFHYSRILPSKLSQADQTDLKEVAALGVKALGMKYSAAHIEIIMTKKGPRIVEIGARNGGYRDRMHQLAHGIDIYGTQIGNLLGEPIDIRPKKDEPCAVLELFPKTPGSFGSLSHEYELHELPSLKYLSIKPKPGAKIGKSSDGFKAAAIIMLHNSNVNQFNQDLDYVNKNVAVITS